MESSNSSSGVVGVLSLLCLVFIVLKLTGFIDWSWWWVLAPVWVSTLSWLLAIVSDYLINR